MYHIVMFTRVSDGVVRLSVLKSEKEARELARLAREGSKELLIQEPIEVEQIDFV